MSPSVDGFSQLRLHAAYNLVKQVIACLFIGQAEKCFSDRTLLRCHGQNFLIVKMNSQFLRQRLAYDPAAAAVLPANGNDQIFFSFMILSPLIVLPSPYQNRWLRTDGCSSGKHCLLQGPSRCEPRIRLPGRSEAMAMMTPAKPASMNTARPRCFSAINNSVSASATVFPVPDRRCW